MYSKKCSNTCILKEVQHVSKMFYVFSKTVKYVLRKSRYVYKRKKIDKSRQRNKNKPKKLRKPEKKQKKK